MFCFLIVVFIVIYLLYVIMKSTEEKQRRQASVQQQIIDAEFEKNMQKRSDHKINILNGKKRFDELINGFYPLTSFSRSYLNTYDELQKLIACMEKENEMYINVPGSNDYSPYTKTIEECKEKAKLFLEIGKTVNRFQDGYMMDMSNYGNVNKNRWDSLHNWTTERADAFLHDSKMKIESKIYPDMLSINIEEALQCLWFCATEKPYSADKLHVIHYIFESITGKIPVDIVIARLYAMKQMGGEDSIRPYMQDVLKNNNFSENDYLQIASALMWMNAYKLEFNILQDMLNGGMTMSTKAQERLHSLSNGGGKAPSRFDVSVVPNQLYFDVSALSWKEDEYIGLFENLTFQEKTLSYALAVRDEDKELFVTLDISVPEINTILEKLISIFEDEYGNSVIAEIKNCVALSGSGEEQLNGILVEANACKQMGILVHVIRIGKKLNIKFYTLFMPIEADPANQKQQVLSLYNRLSPSVSMWESSIKETILMAVQQLLNIDPSQKKEDKTSKNDENPIF